MNRFYWFCALHLRSLILIVAHMHCVAFHFFSKQKEKKPKTKQPNDKSGEYYYYQLLN